MKTSSPMLPLFFGLLLAVAPAGFAADKPNILWITSEDNGPELGCYGDSYSISPNLDALAAKGMRYTNALSNAPVCAPARTTIISGLYPPSTGGEHMRSMAKLPAAFKMYPQFLREAGYYCTNNSKEDYNLAQPSKPKRGSNQSQTNSIWDESSNKAHWRMRKAGQPFFAVFNFTISHESKLRTRPHKAIHDAAKVTVPPYHPDTPEVRQDWAQYYDRLTEMDAEVGAVLQQLKQDGLEKDTIIFYYGDHGCGMPRGKRWLYQSGLRVPMIVHIPERFQQFVDGQYAAGAAHDRLISFVDLAPTIMSLLGEIPPANMQGKAFLGKYQTPEPEYIYGFRDRMDERYDMSRAVRDQNYLYIRNFYPQRPQGTFLEYMFQTPTTKVWKQLFDEGKLNAAQSFFWQPKPAEELYDLNADPYQIQNLADQPAQQETLVRFREAARQWMVDVQDTGFMPEGEMRQRAIDGSPYAFTHNGNYDSAALYDIADQATRLDAVSLEQLLSNRTNPDTVARFWLACGLLNRAMADKDREQVIVAAAAMTGDPSPYVRCIAHEVLSRFGNVAQRGTSIQALLMLADARREGVFVAMTALNSLDWCKPTKFELGYSLIGLPVSEPGLSSRYNSYLPNLIERVTSIASE
ncbi:MAG: sulfatase [Planctomycetales bacterium]|nr:sulfatase [Planctomycetales bacterium]